MTPSLKERNIFTVKGGSLNRFGIGQVIHSSSKEVIFRLINSDDERQYSLSTENFHKYEIELLADNYKSLADNYPELIL
jgi:hypothetical protein